MLPSGLEKKILREAEAVIPEAWKLASAIFARPELAHHEFFASAALTDFLANYGFKITPGAGGLATAFVAELKGKAMWPAVAFLAEMDALPGLGHACGHHLIAAASAGAAAALARSWVKPPGTIKVIGCPAEEMEAGKIQLTAAGVFRGLDAALIAHPDRRTEVFKRSLGAVDVEIAFTGKAAHAAAQPEDGVNALDAVIQTFTAVALLRQQLPQWVRVHGIITDGGQAANIIPARTRAVFMARGLTIKETLAVAEKVAACARGAAKATGAKVKISIKRKKMYAPYVPNRALGETFAEALARLGIKNEQGPEDEGMGSTDVGNASLQAPVLHPLLSLPGVKDGVHTPAFAAAAGGEPGKIMLGRAIRALGLTAAKVLMEKSLRKRVHDEHQKLVASQK